MTVHVTLVFPNFYQLFFNPSAAEFFVSIFHSFEAEIANAISNFE